MRIRLERGVAPLIAAVALVGGCGGGGASALPMPAHTLALAVAPDFAGTIWATTGASPYRSSDGGHSWRPVAGRPGATGVAFAERYALVVGPDGRQVGAYPGLQLSPPLSTPAPLVAVSSPYHKTNRFYALDQGGGVWLSVQAGRDWRPLRAGGLPPGGRAIASVRDLVTQPDIIYVAAGSAGLWRSLDLGASFQHVAGVGEADAVALTTDDQNRVLVAGDGLFLSVDRGRHFTRVSDAAAAALAFDPRNWRLAYAASGGALLRSIDGGATWSR